MLNFEFYSPTRLVFGKGTADRIGEQISPLAKKVLVHYGSKRVEQSGLLKRVQDSLSANGVSFVTLGGVIPNPDVELVREGIALAKKENVELILCVGGGSVIDGSKYVAAAACYDPNQAIGLWERMSEASGGQAPPEFSSTHPNPGTRIQTLQGLMPKAMEFRQKFCRQ